MEEESWSRIPAQGTAPSYLVYSNDIEKPDSDDRGYRLLKLENGLEALLIHDPSTDKAGAAMNVGVGVLSDPVSVLLAA
jgi:insulysin